MRHLESSSFIDDDPTLADFLRRKSHGEKSRMPVYNVNEHSVSIRASPMRESRLGVFTARKASEDRWYRTRTSDRKSISTSSSNTKTVNGVLLKKQILEVTERQPAMKKLAQERARLLSQPFGLVTPRMHNNPLQTNVKFSLLTLQPKRL
jgi:hypothetical protein